MNRTAFYESLRKPGNVVSGSSLRQSQVDGMERLLTAVTDRPISHAAYLLATAYHETGGTMQPVREAFGKTDRDTVNRLDRAWAAGKLGQVKAPYWRFDDSGRAWFGRGYVQLTHRDNYRKAAAITGVDLLGDPSKAMQPEVAAKILVEGCEAGLFTGKRLSDYLPGDYVGARRVVNGQDKAQLIAGYARDFERALQAAGFADAPKTPAKPTSPPTGKKPDPGFGLAAVIGFLLAGAGVAVTQAWESIKAAMGF